MSGEQDPKTPRSGAVVVGQLIGAPAPAQVKSTSMSDLWNSVSGAEHRAIPEEQVERSNPIYRLPQKFGRYMLLKRLGVGGMAEAFLAQQDGPLGFQKHSVVKRMLPHIAEEPRFVTMFQREAKVAAMLTHTNVVQIYELGMYDGIHFIAMEFVDGAPLHKLARTAWRSGRAVPMEAICCAIADAALGLAAAHALVDPVTGEHLNVVHRDISPDNLMINKEGVTKILDFGVAKLAGGEKTATGEVKGKIPFLAPEHILGQPLDGRADIYALGVTFYWLVTGKRPFHAPGDLPLMEAIVKETPKPPIERNAQVPPFINDLILRMIDKNPARRPQTGFEVHDQLQDALALRRQVVVPFVQDILSGEMAADTDVAFQTPGFVPSTPQTEGLKSAWRRQNTMPLPAPNIDPSSTVETVPHSAITMIVRDKKKRTLYAALLGGLLLMAIIAVIAIASTSGSENTATTPPRRPDVVVAPTPPPTPTPTPTPPPTPATPEVTPPEPTIESKHQPVVEKLVDVKTKGPGSIKWLSDGGKALGTGAGTFKVSSGTKSIIAVDPKRGVRSSVAVKDGVADYGALAHGKIQPRANPYADVFLGTEGLGQTPFAPVDVVVGTYTVKFVHEGKKQEKIIEVHAGEIVRPAADFGS